MVRLPDNRGEDRAQESVPSLAALSQEVKELVRLISTTDISELHLESGPVRITIKRGGQPLGAHPGSLHTPPTALPQPQPAGIVSLIGNSPAHGAQLELAEADQVLGAPMGGTFHGAPTPTHPSSP